uniref:C.SpeIP n=1 Tax=Sphaerotilus natans TaxID=34103 RepID=F1KM36_9BURK|nr:C.SpeIP [Sphaerotilus natans]
MLLIVGRLIAITSISSAPVNITEISARHIREFVAQSWLLSGRTCATPFWSHRTHVGTVERGERNITLLNAQRIADALGVLSN